MCFWFGLEILRQVYKKCYLKYWMISTYITFYPSKKVAPPLIGVEKKFLQNWACRVSKEGEFALISKMCRSLEFGKREKNFYRKTEFFGTWKISHKIVFLRKNLCKKLFFWEKSLGTSWRKSSTHFWNQRKIPLLLIPCTPNFEEIFFNSYRGRCCFYGS